jgi:hypothetical protein
MLPDRSERTNEPDTIANIPGIKMVQAYRRRIGRDFINIMPD